MRVLITGAAGMLGTALIEALRPEHEVTGVDVDDFDLSATRSIAEIVRQRPDIVCHLAAFTDVDRCETDPQRAYHSNVVGTRNVAVACREAGCPMLYVSTDYVFDGESEEPYDVDARPRPINMYGRTKLIGEWFVERNVPDRYIVRSSWLFGEGGNNFVETILAISERRSRLEVVNDQKGSPTYTRDLASAMRELIDRGGFGRYHITNSGSCTWYEFAVAIVNGAGVRGSNVEPVTSSELDRPARRPAYSVLDNRVYIRQVGEPLRRWEDALVEYLERRTGGRPNG